MHPEAGSARETPARERLAARARWLLAAFGLPLVAFAVQSLLWPAINPYAWFLFYPVIFVAPRLGGSSSGLTATAVCAGLVWWGFVPERSTFIKTDAPLLPLSVFLLMGIAFTRLDAHVRRSEQKATRAIRALEEAERRKDQFLNAAADPIVVMNDGGFIEYVNTRAEDVFGYANGSCWANRTSS